MKIRIHNRDRVREHKQTRFVLTTVNGVIEVQKGCNFTLQVLYVSTLNDEFVKYDCRDALKRHGFNRLRNTQHRKVTNDLPRTFLVVACRDWRGLCLVAHHAEIPIWIERCDIVKECCTRLFHVRFVTAQIDELLARLERAGNAFTLCAECLTQTTSANNNHDECCK